jgi:hypothetical protein
VYSSSKLREVFHGIDARFIVNVCSVVVDSVLNRLALRSLQVAANDRQTMRCKPCARRRA